MKALEQGQRLFLEFHVIRASAPRCPDIFHSQLGDRRKAVEHTGGECLQPGVGDIPGKKGKRSAAEQCFPFTPTAVKPDFVQMARAREIFYRWLPTSEAVEWKSNLSLVCCPLKSPPHPLRHTYRGGRLGLHHGMHGSVVGWASGETFANFLKSLSRALVAHAFFRGAVGKPAKAFGSFAKQRTKKNTDRGPNYHVRLLVT